MRRIPPALALFIIAPVFGELLSGSAPFNEFVNPITFVNLALLYGCGAIIIRELVIRWGKGWLSLFLLGCAYGIYEEGIIVQSFFDPTWMDLGSLAFYGRVAGVNWVWAEHLTIYHAVISIMASTAFVEAFYPSQRGGRWVSTRTVWVLNWVGFIGVYLFWEILTTYEPGIWRLFAWMAVLALALLARLVPARPLAAVERRPPHPLRFWFTGFIGMLWQFFILYNGADNGMYPYPVTMLLLVAWDALILLLILRWSGNAAAWDDRHRVMLVFGALSFFLIIGLLTVGSQYPVMYFSNPIYLLLLALAAHKVNRRVNAELTPQATPAEV